MKLLDLTLDTPEWNIALDEALLDEAESDSHPAEVLRLWESPQAAVVVGRSSRVEIEVNTQQCRRLQIPILRRSSGGAAVVVGPGCLMYAVVLSYERRPHLHMIPEAHRVALETLADALKTIAPDVAVLGTSDLAQSNRKFSGNSLRCKRTHLLYHGTLLYDFPLDLVSSCLNRPPRQPEYRQGRNHDQFITNLSVTANQLRDALQAGWNAHQTLDTWPRQMTQRLVDEKYSDPQWTYRL
jgi:lipoate-protein ligase A